MISTEDRVLARRTKTILGVDDSREIQKLLQAILCSAGYTYVGASSSDHALAEIVSRNPFDVILLDVEMPGMNGFDACERIRKHPKSATVPIIFLTFHNTNTDVEKCKAVGGNDFIVKPFMGKTLLQHVDRWALQSSETPNGSEDGKQGVTG